MAGERKRVVITLAADTKAWRKQMDRVSRDMRTMGRELQASGKAMTMAFTAPFIGLAAVSLKAYDKQAKAVAQIEAGLKSTGNAAGWTSEQLQKMASDLQSKTIFGDEEILQKSTAQLLTFTTIARDEFARAQKAALDLATRLDGDLQSATIMVGKALNDPIKGLAAMGKAGVQFTEEQKETIKALWNTGQQAEAQRMILAELEKQYGGSAEAAAKAGLGGFKQIANSIGDLSEEFGKILANGINPLSERIKALVSRLQGLSNATKTNTVRIAAFVAAIGPLRWIVGTLVVGAAGMVKQFAAMGVVLRSVTSGVSVTTGAVTAQVFGVRALSLAWSQLSLAMKANVVGIALTVVGAAITAFNAVARKKKEATDQLRESEKKYGESLVGQIAEFDQYRIRLVATNAGTETRKKLIDEINSKYGTTLKNLKDEKGFLDQINIARENVLNKLRAEISLEAQRDALIDLIKRETLEKGLLAKAEMDLAAAKLGTGLGSQKAEESAKSEITTRKRNLAILLQAQKDMGEAAAKSMAAISGSPGGGGDDETEKKTKAVVAAIDELTKKYNEQKTILDNLNVAKVRDVAAIERQQIVTAKLSQDIEVLNERYRTYVDGVKGSVPAIMQARDANTVFSESIAQTVKGFDRLQLVTNDWVEAHKQAMREAKLSTKEFTDGMNQMFEQAIEGSIVAFSDALATAFVDGDWQGGLNKMIEKLADFAQEFGAYLIAYGVSIEVFKESAAKLQGIPAIVAGAAMVAAGAAIKATLAKQTQGYALGTNFAPGGLALVGERGPELVNLPRGSQVHPNHKMHNMTAGGGGRLTASVMGADLQLVLDRSSRREGRYR